MPSGINRIQGDYFTVAELADRFKVTQLTIRRWMYNGMLKAFKVGGVLRFSAAEVERLEADNQIQYTFTRGGQS